MAGARTERARKAQKPPPSSLCSLHLAGLLITPQNYLRFDARRYGLFLGKEYTEDGHT